MSAACQQQRQPNRSRHSPRHTADHHCDTACDGLLYGVVPLLLPMMVPLREYLGEYSARRSSWWLWVGSACLWTREPGRQTSGRRHRRTWTVARCSPGAGADAQEEEEQAHGRRTAVPAHQRSYARPAPARQPDTRALDIRQPARGVPRRDRHGAGRPRTQHHCRGHGKRCPLLDHRRRGA